MIVGANVITTLTEKNSRNSALKSKQTTKKVPPNTFRGFKLRRKMRLIF